MQGIGLGLVFVPLSAATFATLSPAMRAQGTAIYQPGPQHRQSSIGISLVQTVLVRGSVAVHAGLVERLTATNPAWNQPAVAWAYDVTRLTGAAALDAVVNRQATMIAYLNDFRLMLYLTLAVIPLLLLSSRRAATSRWRRTP